MIVACPRCQTAYDLDIPDDGRVSTIVCQANDDCTYQFDVKARLAMVAESIGRITTKQPDNGFDPTMKLLRYVDDMPVAPTPLTQITESEPTKIIFNLSEEDKAMLHAIHSKVTELGLLARMWESMFDWMRHVRGADTPPEV